MGNYKVGDRVKVTVNGLTCTTYPQFIENYAQEYVNKYQRNYAPSHNQIGKIVGVGLHDALNKRAYVVFSDDRAFVIMEDGIKRVATPSIRITTDGNTVHAVLKDGGKVIKRSKAVCAPSDTFDFETGARIAFDRLCTSLAENSKFCKPQGEDKPKYYSGKVVCVKAKKGYWGDQLTVGKVYEIIDGAFVYGDGSRSAAIYTDMPNKKERFAHAEFIEFKPDEPAPTSHTTTNNITIDAKCTSCRHERINEAISTPKLDPKSNYG